MDQWTNDAVLGISSYKAGIRATILTPRDKGMGYLAIFATASASALKIERMRSLGTTVHLDGNGQGPSPAVRSGRGGLSGRKNPHRPARRPAHIQA
jgi:hypothetical protein